MNTARHTACDGTPCYRAIAGRALLLWAVGGVALAGCSFAKFDELEGLAPVSRVGQGGRIESTFFGQLFLGLGNERQDSGGRLVAAGSGDNPAINTITFGPDGKGSSDQSSVEDYASRMELESLVPRSLARAPSDKDLPDDQGQALTGPFVYLGAHDGNNGRVVIADVVSFAAAGSVTPDTTNQAVLPKEFGAAVAGASFSADVDPGKDLVVGGRGRVWLIRFNKWPSEKGVERSLAGVGSEWPSQNEDDSVFRRVAAGDFDGAAGDEAVFAAPDADFVAIIRDVAGCLADETACAANVSQLPLPAGASSPAGFGKALLVADLDGDDELELLVGAPDAGSGGAVYVYDRAALAGGDPTEIAAPAGARSFGRALAIGRIDGTDRRFLAVGAPGSDVTEGETTIADAGKVYLYRLDALDQPADEIALKQPSEGDQLGAELDVLPFKAGKASADLLVSSAPGAALVFFSNTTDQHQDPRQ